MSDAAPVQMVERQATDDSPLQNEDVLDKTSTPERTEVRKRLFAVFDVDHGGMERCVIHVARVTRAKVVHVPLCWFAHENVEVCSVPQKYLSFMYPPAMEPASLGYRPGHEQNPCPERR